LYTSVWPGCKSKYSKEVGIYMNIYLYIIHTRRMWGRTM
jgi:hypothetical protein